MKIPILLNNFFTFGFEFQHKLNAQCLGQNLKGYYI